MKNRLGRLTILFLFMCFLGWTGHARAQKTDIARPVWEYKAFAATLYAGPSVQDQLNQLGAEGWELVAVENVGTVVAPSAVYYFKRLKQSAQ